MTQATFWSRSTFLACALVASAVTTSCGPSGPTCSTASACDAAAKAPCTRCPILPDQVCSDGTCSTRPPDGVDVTATFSIDRHVSGVQGLVIALVAAEGAHGPVTCTDALARDDVAPDVTAYSAVFQTLSGGTFFPDLHAGRVPAGDVVLIAFATSDVAGKGDVLARGCVAGLHATGSALAAPQVDLKP